MNAVGLAQRADTAGRPGLGLAGAKAHPIEGGRYLLVGPATGHGPHHRDGLLRGAAAVLAGLRLANPQLGVLTTLPMDHQDHLAGGFVDVGDDLLD